jgi:hypothetical protein
MSVMEVPLPERHPWPSLGGGICDWLEANLAFGPGDKRGEPYRLDDEKRRLVWRLYEVYPRDHPNAGRRRFRRAALSLRKGSAKTEFGAAIAAVELAPDGPVRCDGWRREGKAWVPIGRPMRDPYIPMLAYTEEQSEELAYSALMVMLSEGPAARYFDIGQERVMRLTGDGKAAALANAPDARDGARTTFELFDEPLALDTLVPTPTGWTTIGDITAGDTVIGRDGKPAAVLGTSSIRDDRPCYRVTFVDGTSVVTDASHRWLVIDRRNPTWGEVTRTTETMAEDLRIDYGYTDSKPSYRWAVPQAEPIDLPEVSLPIAPYVLGVWLGDGDSRAPTVSQAEQDVPVLVTALAARGTTARRISGHTAPRLYLDGLYRPLREESLLGHKHIPSRYLRASAAQRLELLRGLMDTDGHVTRRGWCTFVTSRSSFAGQVLELLRSLGHRPTVIATPDDRSRTGEVIKVGFQSRPGLVPFSFPRKAERCATVRASRQLTRSIMAIDPVPSAPVRCIGVDNEDHLFLVGHGMVPTHNTHRLRLPNQVRAHRTMLANLPKRRMADAWALEVTTAPAPGEGSVAEQTMDYARQVADGARSDARLFFFHRQASEGHDLSTKEGVRAAVVEASGPIVEWSDIDGIAEQWDDPTADRTYLARVWLNMLVKSADAAFDMAAWKARTAVQAIEPGSQITLGFDGSKVEDATALIATDIRTGYQWPLGIWHPAQWDGVIPGHLVAAAVDDAFHDFDVVRMYADPPYWKDELAAWQGRYGERLIAKWETWRPRPMGSAVRNYRTAMLSGELSHNGDALFGAHIGNCRRRELTERDDKGERLFTIQKERPDSPHKIDAAVAAILSWEARTDAIAAGALNVEPQEILVAWA